MTLNEVITQLYQNAPAFATRMNNAGVVPSDIQTIDDLTALPVLRKDDLIALQKENPPFAGFLAVPLSELATVYQSPGPINEPHIGTIDGGNWAIALRAGGFKKGEVVLNALSYHMTPAGASLENSLRAVECVVIPGGIGNQEQQILAMAQFGATGYVGLPSYLKSLLDNAKKLGVPLQLNKALVLAEPFPESLRQELAAHGVTALQAYGSAECGNLGYETAELNGWHVPDNVLLQICDINTGEPLAAGETGEVIVTLLNPTYGATIRFGIGDLSAIIPSSLTDGGPMRIAGWQGRVGAATKVRGMFLHPIQLGTMMKRFPQVIRYQAVVTRSNHKESLALEIVTAVNADTTSLAQQIEKAAREAIKFRLTVKIVKQIPHDALPIRDERTWD